MPKLSESHLLRLVHNGCRIEAHQECPEESGLATGLETASVPWERCSRCAETCFPKHGLALSLVSIGHRVDARWFSRSWCLTILFRLKEATYATHPYDV